MTRPPLRSRQPFAANGRTAGLTRRDKIRHLIRRSDAGRLINQISALAEMPVRLPKVERSPDPRDDFLLGLCEASAADWLVTGDKDDLLVLEHAGANIVTAADMAAVPAIPR